MRRHIPNMITCCNLLSGCVAAVFAFEGVYTIAFACIIMGAVFDFFDGLTARALKVSSPIGKELDSLADVITFGLAPATMAYSWLCECASAHLDMLVASAMPFAAFLLVAFSALRLAKFNVDASQKEEFEGLPTPASAILCLSLAALCQRYQLTIGLEWLALISVLVAALLVSPIKMFSFKFHSWGLGDKDNILRFGFLIVSCLLICLLKLYAIPTIIVMYIAVSALRWVLMKHKNKE